MVINLIIMDIFIKHMITIRYRRNALLRIVVNLSRTFKERLLLQPLACRKVSGNPGTVYHMRFTKLCLALKFGYLNSFGTQVHLFKIPRFSAKNRIVRGERGVPECFPSLES